jgi:hypothetical protein
MRFNTPVKFFLLVSLVVASNVCAAQQERPQTTIEGLQLVEDSKLATVYAQADVDWSHYQKIYLDDPFIAFKKNWQRDQNKNNPGKINSDDMARIKIELSSMFIKVFSETLEEGGYDLVLEPGDDVLLIRPAIIGLNVISPDANASGDSRTYSESAGEMTLHMELYDSLTGDILAKALDRQEDRKTGYFEWKDRVTNRAAANRIMQVWANVLKEGLDDARALSLASP